MTFWKRQRCSRKYISGCQRLRVRGRLQRDTREVDDGGYIDICIC